MPEQLQKFTQSQEKINAAFTQADNIIMRKYMPEIGNYPIKDIPAEIADANINSVLRMNQIDRKSVV